MIVSQVENKGPVIRKKGVSIVYMPQDHNLQKGKQERKTALHNSDTYIGLL